MPFVSSSLHEPFSLTELIHMNFFKNLSFTNATATVMENGQDLNFLVQDFHIAATNQFEPSDVDLTKLYNAI